ncbi:MAG: FG-GAP-like repeat-containing protein [Chthoniobacterales bacterium]
MSSIYAVGAIFALKGDRGHAFEWLEKAKATGKADFTGLAQDPDLASLRDDPRFARLLPQPADFANPFVEPVKIIHEWDGEAANDQFGWIARKLGDVDGDGVPDVVTSAPTSSAAGEKAGRVYVFSGRSGALLWEVDGRAGDELGTGVECAGDTNGDGIPDVVASGPGNGVAYIYSGKDGSVLQSFKSKNSHDESFGRHVAGIGDVDGDGHSDIIIGAPPPEDGPPGKGVGHAYVYSGFDGKLLLALQGEKEGDGFGSAVSGYSRGKQLFLVVGAPQAGPKSKGRVFVYDHLVDTPKFIIEGDATGVALGAMFVSVVGDVDGDSVPDVYASDWQNAAKGPSTGRVYVHSGKDGRRLLSLTGDTQGEGFGTCPANAGDVDHDGHDDLIVGAWQYAGGATSGGRASLFSGKDGKLLKTYTCRVGGDAFGFDAVGMGDVDGDGTIDFLITSGWSGVHGFQSGRIFLISSGIPGKISD